MSQTQPLPPKKEVALALLENSSVHVHLDPRQGAVVVPSSFKKQAQLVLQVGLNMPVPIPDLRLDDNGMTCTLSFKGAPFFCVIPWSSVFAMVGEDGRGMVWPDDVPAEVARQAQGRGADAAAGKEPPKAPSREAKAKADPAKPKRPRKRAALAAVSGEDDPAETPEEIAPAAAPIAQGAQRQFAAPAQASRPAEGATARRRRELPPYLRIVK